MKTKITLLIVMSVVLGSCSIDNDENETTQEPVDFSISLPGGGVPGIDDGINVGDDGVCIDNPDCSMSIPSNIPCVPPNNFNYVSAQNGSWTSSTTWIGGNAPPTGDISNLSIKINHHVYIPNAYIKLKDNSILYVNGSDSSLTLRNGDLLLDGGNAKALFSNTTLRTSGNIELKEDNYVCMIDVELWVGEELAGVNFVPGESSTSANFKNDGGYRWLENVCGNITADFQNLGDDYIIDSCLAIGDQGGVDNGLDGQDSGNFQNDDGQMNIWISEFYIANGDFQNSADVYVCGVDFRLTNGNFQNNDLLEGEDLVIWINNSGNGEIQNNDTWDGDTITLWRTDNGNNPQGISNLPSEADSGTIDQCFDCACVPSPVI